MIGSYSWLNGVFNSWFSQDLDKILSSVKLVEGKLRSKSMAVQVGAISGDKIIPLVFKCIRKEPLKDWDFAFGWVR